MRDILIICDGVAAGRFLETIFKQKIFIHNYTVVSYREGTIPAGLAGENFKILNFDPTSLEKLKLAASGNFLQTIVVNDDKFDTVCIYKNLRKISLDQELYVVDFWGLEKEFKEFSGDSHLKLIDANRVLTSRLMGFLPDSPILADNIGVGKGEIIEVKVPIMSAFAYKKIGLFENERFHIPMIYRHNQYIVTKSTTAIYPNDSLLIVGESSALRNVYSSIKRETGQFPMPYGANLYMILDMRNLTEKRLNLVISNARFLRKKFKNKKFYLKIINPSPNSLFEQIKQYDDFIVLVDYSNELNSLESEIKKYKIGLIVMRNLSFERLKSALLPLGIPVLSLANCELESVNKGIIITNNRDISHEAGVVFDVCSQLEIDIKLYFYDPNNRRNKGIINDFRTLSEFFKRDFEIIDKNENPILALENEQNFLQFVRFSDDTVKQNLSSVLSRNLDELYYKLSKNHQLFVPSFYDI